jgi:phospholipid/cholesterol/gamma-HCH transport system permease protein
VHYDVLTNLPNRALLADRMQQMLLRANRSNDMVAVLSLDISLTQFIGIVQQVPLLHLWLGLAKAPVFAVLIALIGCLEGFKVGGSAQSVGERTTASVVQCIFVVILLDAVAALFYMEMDW